MNTGVINGRRNVKEYFSNFRDEVIRGNLNQVRHSFGILTENLDYCSNLSAIIRNSNAFVAKEYIIYGRRGFDARGAVGMHHYENLNYVRTENELDVAIKNYDYIIAIDNVPGSKPIENYSFPKDKKILLCFGSEANGLSYDILARADDILYIRQYGCVRSLNVAVASGIVLYEITRQFNG